jgi:hypothetical protein
MKSTFGFGAAVVLILATIGYGQAPKPEAEFSHSLTVAGTGKLTLKYRSLHWNEPAYASAKSNPQIRERLNSGLWKRIGTLDSDFDFSIGGIDVPKGSYSLGINFDGNDNFKLVLGSGGKDIFVPLQTQQDSPVVNYLTFDVRPADADSFVLEGRSGKFRSWANIKMPATSAGGQAQH